MHSRANRGHTHRKRGRAGEQKTISALCRKDYLAVPADLSVAEAIQQVRTSAPKGNIFYLYVIDAHGKLVGNISIRRLLTADDGMNVRRLSSTEVVTLREGAPLSHAYEAFSHARFLSLPVVKPDGTLQGVVHAHELLEEYGQKMDDLFEERSRGALFELLGIKAEDARSSAFAVARGRLPWLLVNVVGGSLSAYFIHRLGGGLKQAVEFLALVPILLIVSESVGMQTASLVIANLHRTSSRAGAREVVLRELGISTLLGLFCGALVAGGSYLITRSGPITLAVGFTIAAGSMGVSLLGNAIPLFFHRFKIDPRIAAGPVVLALADSTTLLFYLLVALALSR